MRRFFSGLVLIPLALIFVVFAVANRHLVTVSFDPFNSTAPSLAVTLPLFLLIILVAILGVLAGGIVTWLRQRHWRRAARKHEAEARQAQAQLAELRTGFASTPQDPRPSAVPTRRYGAVGRDKQGATL
jgi:uncharacterized integral membrane protein